MYLKTLKNFIASHMGKLDFLSDYILLLAVLILSYFSYLLICRLLVSFINKYIRSNKVRFDDFIIESGTFKRLSFIVPVLILYNLVFIFPSAKEIIRILCNTLLIWIVILSISALLKGFNNYYESKPKSKMRPIKGYIQIINIIVYIIGIIIFIAMVTGESPMAILGGIGAMTAVLILIFRDTILSFVSSLQISGYDLVHKGDWIEMPKYGADGDVIDIALHTIKVQNWDKTITIIPTSKLIEDGFKNWRGMTQSGGRRIKRAVNIDVSSIKFCDQDMTVKFEKMRIITDYVKAKKDELEKYNRENNINETLPVNGRRMTNIGIFRAYAAAYLKNHPKINRNLTCMVRQLAPGAEGLPVEIYAFTNETEWLKYESIQADIFDHLLSILPHFDLRVFQYPSGMDIRNINNHSSA